jgi:hypothetical protein
MRSEQFWTVFQRAMHDTDRLPRVLATTFGYSHSPLDFWHDITQQISSHSVHN